MNVLLLVIDSLRARSLSALSGDEGATTPFLGGLAAETIHFRRAYATECWTLPTHCSMFTGELPSAHGAHLQTMAYTKAAPTIAEVLSRAGHHTEVVTRNSIFDGSLPGITRGFRTNTQVLSDVRRLNPLAILLALSKPRFRRQITNTGFFHPYQRDNRRFLTTFARATLPADRRLLHYVLARMTALRRSGTPYFMFCNLYDVHAPYAPSATSIFRPFWPLAGAVENLRAACVLPSLGCHAYLRPGFRLSDASRRMLLGRYHRAIELMDMKLAEFWTEARRAGLLDETAVIVTSDHGEAFGEHGLFLHDASVYDEHLHVPLFVHHPGQAPETVDDVVSTRDLFSLIHAIAREDGLESTILGRGHREQHPFAVAEHFYYPRARQMDARYRQNLVAVIAGRHKIVLRREGAYRYDLVRDPHESDPEAGSVATFAAACRQDGLPSAAVAKVVEDLHAWAGIHGCDAHHPWTPPAESAGANAWRGAALPLHAPQLPAHDVRESGIRNRQTGHRDTAGLP